jgi:hypothetical protein
MSVKLTPNSFRLVLSDALLMLGQELDDSKEPYDVAPAALDTAYDAESASATCPGCDEPWVGPGWCGDCATPPGGTRERPLRPETGIVVNLGTGERT